MKIAYPSEVVEIAKILNKNGHSAYAVGGCIRDSIMGRAPQDWDVTTDASPKEMMEIFGHCGIRTLPTGIKHGTVSVLLNGKVYECTTFRIDGEYTDSRHPDAVIFTSVLYDDLQRRDFTINAMAGDPLSKGSDIVDIFGGISDIESKTIKCVGDPYKRFEEDALRILRAVRFATVLDFDIENNTKLAAASMATGLLRVSAERKKSELEKILLSKNADKGIKWLIELDIAKYICADMSYPTVQLRCLSGAFGVRLAALVIHNGQFDGKHSNKLCFSTNNSGQNSESDSNRLPKLADMKLSTAEMKQVGLLCDDTLFCGEFSERNARYMLSVYGELARDAALLRGIYGLAELISSESLKHPAVRISELDIDGNDLKDIGIKPRDIGGVMNKLLRAVIDDQSLNKRDVLISLALSHLD